MPYKIPFILNGREGDLIDFRNASIEKISTITKNEKEESLQNELRLNRGELGKSTSANLIITIENKNLFLKNIAKDSIKQIFKDSFDSSSYQNAYFTSDGKNVVLQISKNEGELLGINDLQSVKFDVEGFTVARNEGINGYKPEITLSGGRKPVWRDPITLDIIPEDKMSSHIFMSPDGLFSANIIPGEYYYNRLTGKEISFQEYIRLCSLYNWRLYPEPDDKEKKRIIENRTNLLYEFSKEKLEEHLVEYYRYILEDKNANERTREHRLKEIVDSEMNKYLNKVREFTPLFIDKLHYVGYKNNITNEEDRIIIGRNVWYLNYVSFSYDCHYLAFGAKMKSDLWRNSEEGVFVLYDLHKREIIIRKDGFNLQAVWMAMFSQKGDVAFYDSSANAYLVKQETNYKEILVAIGKSLLCFSPSGKYIALSDQKYIDYAHHPNENWGHQPSGNVFIHAVEDFKNCIEAYNDFGEGIEGVANGERRSRAKSVASAAFSQDETKLLVVGNDGVVVVRNLKKTI